MLQTLLARDHLMCGFDNGLDPSQNLEFSGLRGDGSRPTVFFGPKRDALHLITKRTATLVLLRPKKFIDFEPKVYALSFAANDSEVSKIWQQQIADFSQQIYPKAKWMTLKESHSNLFSEADIYDQEFRIENSESNTWEESFRLKIRSLIIGDSLHENLSFELPEDFECWVVHWHKPEIGAAHHLQSTHVNEDTSTLTSFRSNVFFAISAQQEEQVAKLAFAEAGWRQQSHFAYNRLPDLLDGISSKDDVLGYLYSSKSSRSGSWLGVESRSFEAIGDTDGLIVWSCDAKKDLLISYSLKDSIDNCTVFNPLSFSQLTEEVLTADRQWLAAKKPAPDYLNQQAKDYYSRTLLTLRQMQDTNGGIIAAPEFHYPFTHCGGYGYCWGRDAGFISYAMDVCGLHDESAAFYRYMAKCQSQDGSFLHRHDMDGNLGASWGFLQPDETGSVVFGLWQHIKLAENRDIATELRSMVEKATDWLVESKHAFDEQLPIEGHDLWEERVGVHFYAVAAMAAGIEAGIKIFDYMGWTASDSWQARFTELRQLLHSERFIAKVDGTPFFARTLLRNVNTQTKAELENQGAVVMTNTTGTGRQEFFLERDFVVDIAQLGAGYPYSVFDFDQMGDDWDHLINQVDEQLWRPGVGGAGRYESDFYRDGNPWILATLWLGLAADQRGQKTIARKCWNWTLQHTTPEGLLPEQVDPKTGNPAWVMPLTWSHAMYALAVHQFSKEVVT